MNCLLATLARGTATSVTLTEGAVPPDPARLTADSTDLEWITTIGFALDRVSTPAIICLLLNLAGFRWFRFGKTEGRIEARLVGHGGEASTNAVFRVTRRRREGRAEVEVAPVRR